MMNIVYVLVSSPEDTYFEQTLISVYSLRKCMPDCRIVVVTEPGTVSSNTIIGKSLSEYSVELMVIDNIDQSFSNLDKSRYLKTTLYNYIFDDFLYIDGDTIVCGDLSRVGTGVSSIGCILDKHFRVSEHPSRNKFALNARKCGFSNYEFNDCHFNGGVLFVKKNEKSEEFFKLWNKLWYISIQHGLHADQASLNEANCRMGGVITEINGKFNCQIANRTKAMKYFNEALLIHYFASYKGYKLPYDVADNLLQKEATDGIISDKLKKILARPKSAFNSCIGFVSDVNDAEIEETFVYYYLRSLYIHSKKKFMLINKIAKAILHFKK